MIRTWLLVIKWYDKRMLIFDDETDNTVGLGRVGQAGGGVEQGGKRSWRSFSLSSFSSSHSSILFLAKFLSLPHSSRFVLQRHFCHRHILPDLFLATFLSLPHSSRLFFCDGIFFIVAFLQAFFLQRHFCHRYILAGCSTSEIRAVLDRLFETKKSRLSFSSNVEMINQIFGWASIFQIINYQIPIISNHPDHHVSPVLGTLETSWRAWKRWVTKEGKRPKC